jgi:hypothetical protein
MEIHSVLKTSTAIDRKKDAGELVELMGLRFQMDRVAGMGPQLRMEEQKVGQRVGQNTRSPKLKQ